MDREPAPSHAKTGPAPSHAEPRAAAPPFYVFHEIHGKRREGEAEDGNWKAVPAQIRDLAEAQHGVVSRRQLLASGFGKGLIQDRVRAGLLTPVHRGVYAVGHRRHDLLSRWMAAVLACGSTAVLSHASAAHLWGLRGSRQGVVDVSRPTAGRRRRGIFLHRADLPADEVTTEARIPVTTIERTLVDCAPDRDERQLARMLAAAARDGRLSWRILRGMIERRRHRAGMARLRAAVDAADPGAVETRSGAEIDLLGLISAAGIPAPSVNALVLGHMVDLLWPERRLIVELDSYRFHGGRAEFNRDRRVTLELEAAGYDVVRLTDEMLAGDPRVFLDLLREKLGLRREPGLRFPRHTWKT